MTTCSALDKKRTTENSGSLPERSFSSESTNDFFWNVCFDKGRIKNYVSWFLLNNGEHKTVALLDRLKTIGFESATKAGISLGIDDLKIPPKKLALLHEADLESQLANQKYKRGDLLEVERFQRLISSWHRVSEFLKTEVVRHFEETNTLNPVYMMAFSGARGNISQVRQLVGMRGLMADPQGRIIDFPILSNFREGLTLTEYLISCYGARKGIVDTALRTANAGYLTRRLVDVAHHVIISNYDCGTVEGVGVTAMKEGNKLIYSLQNRLIGRVLAETIIKDGSILGLRNQEISHDLASQIASHKTKVTIRSPLTCASKNLVCQLCYGWSLADGRLVSIGEAVGIIAAQSIGEPGTQLTMRTFHTGGVFSSDVSDQIKAPYDGIVIFPEPIVGTLVRTPEGNIVFLTKAEGEFNIQKINNENQITKYKIPPFTLLFIRNTQKVLAKDLVAQITGVAQQTAQRDDSEQMILSQLEGQIFFASLRLRKYKTSSQFDSRQNKMEVWTQSVAEEAQSKNKPSNRGSFSYKRKEPSFRNPVNKSTTIGLMWLLAGKIYQFPIKTSSFVKVGDLVTSQTIINELIWYSPGERLSFTQTTALPTPNSILNLTTFVGSNNQNNSRNGLSKDIYLLKQQSKVTAISYKEFGYLFKLNYASSIDYNRQSNTYRKQRPLLPKQVTNDFLILASPLASNQTSIKETAVGQKIDGILGQTVQSLTDHQLGKKGRIVTNRIHPNFMFYSKTQVSPAGGLFIFQDDLPLIKNLQKVSLNTIIFQIKQHIFSSSRETLDLRKVNLPHLREYSLDKELSTKKNINLVAKEDEQSEFVALTRDTFNLHIKTWLQKFYLLKWRSLVSPKQLKSDSFFFKNYSFKTTQIRLNSNNLNSCTMRSVVTTQYPNTIRSLNLEKRKTLVWAEQQFYILNGYYSNSSQTVFGLPALKTLSRPSLLPSSRLPGLRTSRASFYVYKAAGKQKSYSFASKKALLCSSVNLNFCIRSLLYNSLKKKTLYTMQTNKFSSTNLNANQKLTLTACYLENSKSWTLLKTTFGTTSTKMWLNRAKSSNLVVLNRQGKVKALNTASALLTIHQKSPTQPSTFLLSSKRYNHRLVNNQSEKQNTLKKISAYNNTFKSSKAAELTAAIDFARQFKKIGLNMHQQVHNYQIAIKKGLVYIPHRLQNVFNFHKSYYTAGEQILDNITFSQPCFIEYFTLPLGQSSHLTKSSQFSVKLKILTGNSRYCPRSVPDFYQQNCLLVLIRPTKQIVQSDTLIEIKQVKNALQKTQYTLNSVIFRRIVNYTSLGNKSTISIMQHSNHKTHNHANSDTLLTNSQFSFSDFLTQKKIARTVSATTLKITTETMKFGSYSHLSKQHYWLAIFPHFEKRIKSGFFSRPNYLLLAETFRIDTDLISAKAYWNEKINQFQAKSQPSLPPVQITNAFLKQFKVKLQSMFEYYRIDLFINTLTLYSLTQQERELATIFKRLYELNSKQTHEQYPVRQSLLTTNKWVIQPHFFIEYLNKILRTKTIRLDKRPWYIRGFFQYRVGDLLSIQHITTNRSRELKSTQEYWLPKKYLVNFANYSRLKQTNEISKGSILSKILNNGSLSFYQPISFSTLLQQNLYFSTRQALNFRPIHLMYTAPKDFQTTVHINPVSSNILANLDPSLAHSTHFARPLFDQSHIQPQSNSNLYPTNIQNTRFRRPSSSDEKYLYERLNANSGFCKYSFPGTLNIGFNCIFDSKLLLQTVKQEVSTTKSLTHFSQFGTSLTNLGVPLATAKSYCLSPFSGEILNFKQSLIKSQFLVLTPKDQVSLNLFENPQFSPNLSKFRNMKYESNTQSVKTSANLDLPASSSKKIKRFVGHFIKYGDLLNSTTVSSETGVIIHSNKTKITLRRSQYIAASNKALLHVKNNDWIDKNVPLATLPFQRLKAGDIVQGIPKIEQYFEARKSKAGRFYRDSIPNLMNAIFNHYLTRFRLSPYGTTTAAKKAILKVQQILLNGIQRVYRTQGVSIADKHIEIIVRQMTSKVRILNPGLASFLPGELVDINTILHLNRYLEQEIHFEPLVLGITQASLEVDSFISASSFQQTTRVLSEAALDKKRDYLRGLKENVILGNLIPAGTGHHIQQK